VPVDSQNSASLRYDSAATRLTGKSPDKTSRQYLRLTSLPWNFV
jgi:hypothetical protein